MKYLKYTLLFYQIERKTKDLIVSIKTVIIIQAFNIFLYKSYYLQKFVIQD